MDGWTLAADRLVALAERFIARGDMPGLAAALDGRWSPECLELLLIVPDAKVVSLVAVCLGVVGGMQQSAQLARLLYHSEAGVAQAAEDALWSIWFRAGGDDARRVTSRAADLLHRELPHRALPLLDALLQRQPTFAEGFHQRSIAHYMLGRFEPALRDARHACRLNPRHFAAWASQGNCQCELGQFADALASYREALAIHPRLELVRQSIRELREGLNVVEA